MSTAVGGVETGERVLRRGGSPSSRVGIFSVLDETNVNIYPGKATTYAGNGTNATVDGTGTSASFKDMGGVEVVRDGSGNPFAYVATTGSIRKVNLQTGQVSTLTGSATATGCTYSPDPAQVRLDTPHDLSSDGSYLYTRCGNDVVKISLASGEASKIVTLSAGNYGGLTYAADGYLYVGMCCGSLRQVHPVNGTVTTIDLGGLSSDYSAQGLASDAQYLWIAQKWTFSNGSAVLDRVTLPIVGQPQVQRFTYSASVFGTGQLVSTGNYLYMTSFADTELLRITKADGKIVKAAGTPDAGFADGTGTDAWFAGITGVASDGTRLWVADSGNHRLRKLEAEPPLPSSLSPNASSSVYIYPGKATTYAGNGTNATVDGTGTSASFKDMGGVEVVRDSSGNPFAYVATTGSIRKVNLQTGQVSTLTGSPTATGCTYSTDPSQVRLDTPHDLSSDGYYLFTRCGNDVVRISLATGGASKIVTLSAGNYGGLTYAADGFLYVGMCCGSLRQIDPVNSTVTIIDLGGLTSDYSAQGLASDAQYLWIAQKQTFSNVSAVLDRVTLPIVGSPQVQRFTYSASVFGTGQLVSAGNYLYMTSFADDGVLRITKRTGGLGRIVGGTAGDADAEWGNAHFGSVSGVASDGNILWISDSGNHKLRKLEFVPLRAREFGPGSSVDGSTPRVMTGDPVDSSSGNFSEAFTDVSLPGIGLPFAFTRYYNSMLASAHTRNSLLRSSGWTHSLDASVELIDVRDGQDQAIVHMPTGQDLLFNDTGTLFGRTSGVYDALERSGAGYTLTQADGTKYHFDAEGRLADITARTGHTIQLHWTGANLDAKVDYVIDTVGRRIDFTYNAPCGFLSRITLPDGRYVEYRYDTFNCRMEYVYELDADGLNRRFIQYTWIGDFLATIDRGMGTITSNSYDDNGRVTQQQTVLSTTTYTYSDDLTTLTRNGHTWIYDSSPQGRIESITDPNGNTTTFSNYDVNDNPQTVTRPGGQVWSYIYGGWGQLQQVTPPIASADVHYTYDPTSFPAFPRSMTDGRGNVTRWVYDSASGDLQCEILPTTTATTCAGAAQADKISYAYTADHQLREVTDPNGHITTYAYFGSTSNPQKKGLLQSVTTHLGLTTTYDYNAYLQQWSMVTPQGNANGGGSAYEWRYTFDDAGRLVTVTDPLTNHPLGFTTKYEYDAEGNLTTITDADDHKIYHAYVRGGILCATGVGVSVAGCTGPPGATTYNYDADGNLQTVRDGNGHVTTFTYWEDGELKRVTDPLNRTWSFSLRSYGPTTSSVVQTLNSEDTVTSTFDAMDRLTTVAYSTPTAPGLDPAPTQQYAYDANSNLCYADTGPSPVTCSSTGGTGLTYDQMNRMLTAGGFSYAYYPAGNLKRRTYPDGRNTSYTYDGDDRLCGINFSATPPSNCSTGTINWDYSQLLDPTSKVTKNFPEGRTIITFDKAGRLDNLVNKTGPSLTNLSTFNPTLSPAGFPQTVVATNTGLATALQSETQTFTFDATTARLTRVCYDAGGTCGSGANVTGYSYAYDDAGNIRTKTVHGGGNPGTTTSTYDDANQLLSDGTNTYAYTANGDRRTAGSTQYRYDLAHRLTQAGGTYSYTYDDLGNRTTDKVGAAAPTTYDWDPNGPVPLLATTTDPSGVRSDFHYGGTGGAAPGRRELLLRPRSDRLRG